MPDLGLREYTISIENAIKIPGRIRALGTMQDKWNIQCLRTESPQLMIYNSASLQKLQKDELDKPIFYLKGLKEEVIFLL